MKASTAGSVDAARSKQAAAAVVDESDSGSVSQQPGPDVQTPDPDVSGGGGGGGLVRVTVNLTPKAYEALQRSGELTRDSKTDTINRALLVYDLILQLTEQGGGHLTMVNGRGEKERIHII